MDSFFDSSFLWISLLRLIEREEKRNAAYFSRYSFVFVIEMANKIFGSNKENARAPLEGEGKGKGNGREGPPGVHFI